MKGKRSLLKVGLAVVLLSGAISGIAAGESVEEAATEMELSQAADPYSFIDLTGEGASSDLTVSAGEDLKLEYSENGLFVSGQAGAVNEASFTFQSPFRFGEEKDAPIRVRIDGLARVGREIHVQLFLDDEAEPFAEKQLKPQTKEDSWEEEQPVFCELSRKISGDHTITLRFADAMSAADKKTGFVIRSLRFYRGSIPVVSVTINENVGTVDAMNTDVDHNTRCYGNVSIQVPEGFRSDYQAEGDPYEGGEYALDYIRGRGESTWEQVKKPYKIKLDEKEDLFGMGAAKDWALIANYFDPSFVRNRLTYHLGTAMGLPYTPQLVPVEFVLNGDYQGLYYLSETVRIDDTHVAIDDLEDFAPGDEDITGGYLVSVRRYWQEEGKIFDTPGGSHMMVVSPEKISDPEVPEEKLEEMYDYIIDYVNKTEEAVLGKGGKDKEGKPYTDYIDLETMAIYYLIQEVSRNQDAFTTDSTFLYKPRGDKLYFGPLWDFDYVAWGANKTEDYSVDDAMAAPLTEEFIQEFPWFYALRSDPVFLEAVDRAWNGKDGEEESGLRYQLNELSKDGGILDSYEEELALAAENNADLPGYTADYKTNYVEEGNDYLEADFHNEIFRLKRWIRSRTAWIDENLDGLKAEDIHVQLTFLSDGQQIDTMETRRTGTTYGLPVPESEGRYFAGWYAQTEEYDEETDEMVLTDKRFGNGTMFPTDMELTAKWIPEGDPTLPEAIWFGSEEVWMKEGNACQLGCTLMPEGSDETLFYQTSDDQKAEIDDNGKLTLIGSEGDVTITAKTPNGLSASCLIHIVPSAQKGEEQQGNDPEEAVEEAEEEEVTEDLYGFSVGETQLTLKAGEYRKLDLQTEPEKVIWPNLRILNADEDIAVMTPELVVTARKPGTATIFVVIDGVEEAVKLSVTVTEP